MAEGVLKAAGRRLKEQAESISGADEILKRIRSIVAGSGDRAERARQVADVVRSVGNYRWVGLYDVGEEMVSIIAWSGGAYSSASSSASGGAHRAFRLRRDLRGPQFMTRLRWWWAM